MLEYHFVGLRFDYYCYFVDVTKYPALFQQVHIGHPECGYICVSISEEAEVGFKQLQDVYA